MASRALPLPCVCVPRAPRARAPTATWRGDSRPSQRVSGDGRRHRDASANLHRSVKGGRKRARFSPRRSFPGAETYIGAHVGGAHESGRGPRRRLWGDWATAPTEGHRPHNQEGGPATRRRGPSLFVRTCLGGRRHRVPVGRRPRRTRDSSRMAGEEEGRHPPGREDAALSPSGAQARLASQRHRRGRPWGRPASPGRAGRLASGREGGSEARPPSTRDAAFRAPKPTAGSAWEAPTKAGGGPGDGPPGPRPRESRAVRASPSALGRPV